MPRVTMKSIRDFLGLTQEELGEKLDMSRQSIYKMESENQEISTAQYMALSRIYGDEIIKRIKASKQGLDL